MIFGRFEQFVIVGNRLNQRRKSFASAIVCQDFQTIPAHIPGTIVLQQIRANLRAVFLLHVAIVIGQQNIFVIIQCFVFIFGIGDDFFGHRSEQIRRIARKRQYIDALHVRIRFFDILQEHLRDHIVASGQFERFERRERRRNRCHNLVARTRYDSVSLAFGLELVFFCFFFDERFFECGYFLFERRLENRQRLKPQHFEQPRLFDASRFLGGQKEIIAVEPIPDKTEQRRAIGVVKLEFEQIIRSIFDFCIVYGFAFFGCQHRFVTFDDARHDAVHFVVFKRIAQCLRHLRAVLPFGQNDDGFDFRVETEVFILNKLFHLLRRALVAHPLSDFVGRFRARRQA